MKARSTRAQRLGFGVLAIAATLLTSACATGQDAMTAGEVSVVDGAEANAGTMALRAILVAAPPNKSYAVGADAQLKLVVVNDGSADDALVSVTTPAFASASIFESGSVGGAQAIADSDSATATPSATPSDTSSASTAAPANAIGSTNALPISPGKSVIFGHENAQPEVLLRSLTTAGAGEDGGLFPGESISITFTFQQAGSVTVQVPVELSPVANTVSVPPLTSGAE